LSRYGIASSSPATSVKIPSANVKVRAASFLANPRTKNARLNSGLVTRAVVHGNALTRLPA
jgi:hypothetical protein